MTTGSDRAPQARAAVALRGALLALALLSADPAAATQEYILPTLFDVTGVGADDVLNIRAAPSAGAEIIGALAHDASGVEVVAHDRTGRWAQVNSDGRSGWVALRYLAYRTDVWEEGELPRGLRCLGTEPFWALGTGQGTVVLSRPDAPDQALSLEAVLSTGVFRDPRRALVAKGATEGANTRLTASIIPTACSDGMSDRAYGLDATLILAGPAGSSLLVGCCSLAP